MARFVPIWLVVASVACAQETAPPSAARPAPPKEDAIAAAKRDFNALKSAKGSLDQPKASLPPLSTPELHTTAPRPLPSSKVDPKTAKKSENWLVDAMMKPDETTSRDPGDQDQFGVAGKREREGVATKTSRRGTDPRETSGKREDSELGDRKAGPEFNPLARYMPGWMTPQDYALLKPGFDDSAAASLTSRGDPSLPTVGADLSGLDDARPALDFSRDAKATRFELSKQADNPFLQSVNAHTTSPALVALTPPATSSATPAPTLAPARVEAGPAKSKIPDFAKPATDEKYFKQLKRF